MKVKIQYTVDIEEVTEEVYKRISFVKQYFDRSQIIEDLLNQIKNDNIINACETIDVLRKELSYTDSVLEDSYKVLVGYASYKSRQLENSEEVSTTNADEK